MKNVLAIHDISCVGRCSLTVALPIVSAFGATCSVFPTAVLSTHTGGFTGFTCLDLTDEMRKIFDAWAPLDLQFDAVYSGFLASNEQIDIVKQTVERYKSNPAMLAVIDPVMADYGKLYQIFDTAFVQKMAELIPYADVLVPNMTEASFLSGIAYKEGPYDRGYVEQILHKLQAMGAKNVVLTGVYFKPAELGAAVMTPDGKTEYYFAQKIEGNYHGTGDVFGSALTGALMRGEPLFNAAQTAVNFVVDSIKATPPEQDKKYGVDFETVLAAKR